MEAISQDWHPALLDPSRNREYKPRTTGKTMVIDKGMGMRSFEDLLQTSAEYIDMIKIGFGTSVLYPRQVLLKKIELAKENGIHILPGGTFLEAAVQQNVVEDYLDSIQCLGFNTIEVSDGTIELSRSLRDQLIRSCLDLGLIVITEYGKKSMGSKIEIADFIQTVQRDTQLGASLVTMEGRESGIGVGIYDHQGGCKDEDIIALCEGVQHPEVIMWEAPLKSQQVHLIQMLGAQINLGNIAPEDILSLEALRRGLRSDTFNLSQQF